MRLLGLGLADGQTGWMWIKEHRARQAVFERRRCPTDLTDEEWEQIAPFLPAPAARGRSPKAGLREVLNTIRYMSRCRGGWRMLPVRFGPWRTVYWWFRRFVRRQLFQPIHDIQVDARPRAGGARGQSERRRAG